MQLAVLLPPAGALRAVGRLAVPVAVDLASALPADGHRVVGGVLAVPARLALAPALVGLAEGRRAAHGDSAPVSLRG